MYADCWNTFIQNVLCLCYVNLLLDVMFYMFYTCLTMSIISVCYGPIDVKDSFTGSKISCLTFRYKIYYVFTFLLTNLYVNCSAAC